MTIAPPPDPRPRLLCLHGGGTNADIFTLQSRSLISTLSHFRLVFADAPFFCAPGPGIVPVYELHGPFRRWLRWLPEHASIEDDTAEEEIRYAISTTMTQDEGIGPWVGLLGFSQGAKVGASLLFEEQVRSALGREGEGWRFAVLFAGRMPLVSLSRETRGEALVRAGGLSEGFVYDGVCESVLRLPTVHVHGLRDGGLHLHRRLMDQYCDPDSVTLVEWDGDHRVPFKKVDVDRVCEQIYRVAREQGVDC